MTLSTVSAKRRAAAPLLLSAGSCCTALLLHDARRAPAAIDRYILSAGYIAQQPTLRTPLLMSIAGTDGRADGQAGARPLPRPCSSYYAGGVNNSMQL